MTVFRCPQCGVHVYARPGKVEATCPRCNQPAVMVLSPPAPPAGRPGGFNTQLGKWLALGAVAIVLLALGLRFLAGPGEPTAIMASGNAVPLSKLPTPVHARPVVSRGGRRVAIGVALADAKGNGIRDISLGLGQQMPLPRITVLDERGQVVHTGKLEYG